MLGPGEYHWDTVHRNAQGFFQNQRSRGGTKARKEAAAEGEGKGTTSSVTKTTSEETTPADERGVARRKQDLPRKARPPPVIPVPQQQCRYSSSLVLIPTLLWYAGLASQSTFYLMSINCDGQFQMLLQLC